MKFKLKTMTMKTLKTIPVMLLAAALLSCEKSGPENPDPVPPVPEENTLEVDKTDISLCYLERDTINVPGVDAANVQWSIAEGGDGIITLLGNVVVGRRKGEATVVASHEGESAAIKVTVTTEEYIPVEKLIWEINGQRVESVDDENTGPSVSNVVYYLFEEGGSGYPIKGHSDNLPVVPSIPANSTMEFKFIGYEPANASCPILANIGSGITRATVNEDYKNTYLNDSGDFTVSFSMMIDYTSEDNPLYLIYHLYPFPPDLQPTSYDIDQMSASYRSPENEVEYYNANKFLCFDVKQPNIEVKGEVSIDNPERTGIYLKSGESKRIEDEIIVIPFVPEDLQNTYQFGLGRVRSSHRLSDLIQEETHCGKLHLSEDNILSLDEDFSFADIENAIKSGKCDLTDYGDYSGDIDNLRAKDSIRIGSLVTLLLPEDGLYYDMVKEKFGAEYAALMARGGSGTAVYWVKE